MTSGSGEWVALGALLVAAGALIAKGRHLRGTTLVAPAVWTFVALAVLAGFCWYSWQSSLDHRSTATDGLRLLAGVATFCPMMAVLGARRPQHRGWQWIVLTLWVVLALPAAEAYFVRRGGSLRVHDARGWFLWILLLLSFANGIMTRYWPSVLLCVSGQFLMLAPFLPMVRRGVAGERDVWLAALLIAAALLAPVLGIPPRIRARPGLDRLWQDFRDSFGSIWALRIQERVNVAAARYDWPLRLSWQGFVPLDDRQSEAARWLSESGNPAEKMVRSLLRRYVSTEWMDRRLDA